MIEIQASSAHYDALKGILDGLNAELTAELRAANARIGATLNADAKKVLQEEIYNVPIPLKKAADRKLKLSAKLRGKTTKGSAGKWTRTGNLKRDENFAVLVDSQGAGGVRLYNNANYSTARATLGTQQSKRRAGVQRSQTGETAATRSQTRPVGNWQRRVVELRRKWIAEQYAAAIRKALGRR